MRLRCSCLLIATVLAACGDSDDPSPVSALGCARPAAATATQQTLTINVPQDFDASVNPAATTNLFFTVMQPARCPGNVFPLVLHSHGFGGSRYTALAANGDLAGRATAESLAPVLPHHGFVVISFDERGQGEATPANGGGYGRLIDPNAETADARAILDWAYDHAAEFNIQTEPGSGIAKDVRVGTLGGSYGGGWQFPMAALDARIDTIVADYTWHTLLYSLLPGDAVKLGWAGLFSSLIQQSDVGQLGHAYMTPLVTTLANQIGAAAPNASTVRTRADLFTASALPTATPRPVTEAEAVPFFYEKSMDYFEAQQAAGAAWGYGEAQAVYRPIPALLAQGNRDVLFNLTEAFWNFRYLSQASSEVHLLSHEGGHMNAIVMQASEPLEACGTHSVPAATLAWYQHHLQGTDTAAFTTLPKVCISVTSAPTAPDIGVTLAAFPVGSLSGTGAVPALAPTLDATVLGGATEPVFVPVATISGAGQVLAGAPRLGSLVVSAGLGATVTPVAYVGVGIVRGGETILVDEQVTAFVEGTHDSNRNVQHAGELLLPGVGEVLQDGDQVGLLFYEGHAQYRAVNAGGQASVANPYVVSATDVGLPILVPGTYPGSALSE